MSEIDLFKKAAECERLAEEEVGDTKKRLYLLLRDAWIARANASDRKSLADDIALLEEFQMLLEMDATTSITKPHRLGRVRSHLRPLATCRRRSPHQE
jgi:hypothetical protein